MRIAFIGTSHVGAIKVGWDLLPDEYKHENTATFIGFSAPALAKQTFVGWKLEDALIKPTDPSVRYFLKQTSGSPDTPIAPLAYDAVCFVDMFFCYDFALMYANQDGAMLMAEGAPISDLAYQRMLEQRLGLSKYTNHPTVGDVPETDQIPLMKRIFEINPKLQNMAFLSPRPFSPAQRAKARFPMWSNASAIRRAGEVFDAAAMERLDRIGIKYLPRTSEQICDKSGATPDAFSAGWIDDARTQLNEHMNDAYGAITVKQILERLSGGN